MQALQILHVASLSDELAIAWNDGEESFLKLPMLRECCPCANCQGEPDALGRVIRPPKTKGPRADELLRYEVMGGYALQLFWGDGHSTGIYTYTYLRTLGKTIA